MRIIRLSSIMLLGLTTSWAVPAGAAPIGDLAGSWRGTFWQVNAGDTGYVHGDVELEVNDDGSYRETLITRQVAGSSRAGCNQMTGTVAVNSKGNRVALVNSQGDRLALKDWRRTTLRDNGDELHGVMIDPSSGRTIAVRLAKVEGRQ
jgi:hypothetical protein